MRTQVALVLVFSGCQLLPQYRVQCAESDRCEPAAATDGGTTTDMPTGSVIAAPFVLGHPDAQTNWLQRVLGR